MANLQGADTPTLIGHGLTERAHQLDSMGRILEWMDRYTNVRAPAR